MTTTTPDETAAPPRDAVPAQVYQVFIKASAEQIWEAITTPEFISRYFHGSRADHDLRPGGRYLATSPDGAEVWTDATIVEVDPPRRFVHGWRSLYSPDTKDEPESRVTWEIEDAEPGVCLLTVTHDHLDRSPRTAASVGGRGWMVVISGLKTLLETGQPLFADR